VGRADSLRIFVRRFVVALVVATVISGSAVLVANVVESKKFNNIHTIRIPDNVLSDVKPGAPTNYLIIGSDSRNFVDTPEQAKAFGSAKDVGTGRSDVMMIVHTEPDLGTALVVSFPRDTEVAIEGHGHDKLNAAFAYGGPELTIRTIRKDFGIPIQHFLAVNFVGFQKIVDAIGHVKIYFPTPARDVYTGLYQPTAGCVSLNGERALQYARSRHYLIPREGVANPDPNKPSTDWIEDPRSDLDRILRQQYFLRSLGQTALNRSVGNPLTAFALADAVTSSMSKDQTLTNKELKSLVRTFRGLDPATVEMTTLPVSGGTDGQPLVPEYPEAQPVLDRLKDLKRPAFVLPEAAEPSSVKLVVVDGSGVKGLAAQVEADLVARGFRSGGSADASISNYEKTQVRYAIGEGKHGLSVAEYVGTGNAVQVASTNVQDGNRTLRGDVLVVLGRDYPSLHGLLDETASSTTSGSTSVTGGSGAAPSTSSTTTTTSVTTPDARYVPVSRDPIRPLVGCP
jgi:LCP family protein required for cell wall assembly